MGSYRSSGLKVYTLLAVPSSAPPEHGYPVLIMNHGFHPNPKRYGIRKDDRNDRPGDYYWDFPGLYARKGFLVLMPDYRGHNESEGFEFTDGFLASNYYTIDVLNLLSAVPSIEAADGRNIFMWGHSMGGEVTLRALLATDRVKAASIWAPVVAGTWEQAFHYSRMRDAYPDRDDLSTPKSEINQLERDIAALGFEYRVESGEPLGHLHHLAAPVVIHHARGDRSVPYEWSERLATRLYRLRKPYVFYSYDTPDHLLNDETRIAAVRRDIEFFSSFMPEATP